MENLKFLRCKHCGNLMQVVVDGHVSPICCGEKMELLVENTVEASKEKHLPAVSLEGKKLTAQVGSVLHPMSAEHHIEFVCLQTCCTTHIKRLKVNEEPIVTFECGDETPIAVYEFCNLHGLWKTIL